MTQTEHKYLDQKGLMNVFKLLKGLIAKKIDKDLLVPITIDEYNALGDDIDNNAFYFIIDKDDDIFDKIKEIFSNIDTIEDRVQKLEEFKNQFPIDNRTYAIINQQPKNLSEVFPDELGIPTDNN